MLFQQTNPPGFGVAPGRVAATFTNRAGVSGSFGDQGVLTMLDLFAADGDVDSGNVGDSGSVFANVIAPSGNAVRGLAPFIGVVAQESAADNAAFEGLLYGLTDALVIGASGSMALGTDLVAAVGGHLDIVVASGETVVGIGLEAVTTPSSATLGRVFYMGGYLGTYTTTAYA